MDLAVANGYVAGPQLSVIPCARVASRRIISLHFVISILRFINTIAMNSVATLIQLVTSIIGVIGIGYYLESINDNPAGHMKAYVIDDDPMFAFSADGERMFRI